MPAPFAHRRTARRCGFTVLETAVAAALLAVALTSLVAMVRLVDLQQRQSARRAAALDAANNLLERVLAVDWHEIETELPAEAIRADVLLAGIPGGTWKLTVRDETSPLPAKEITVSIGYGPQNMRADVELTAWAFPDATMPATPQPDESTLDENAGQP